jgi:hypothetical protein
MPEQIRVPVPSADEDLQRYFQTLAQGEGFRRALDLSVAEFDELAQLAALSVTQVEAVGAAVAVHYRVAWTAFHACDDTTVAGQQLRIARGRIDGSAWIFERPEPLPGRHTGDEF